MLKTHGLTKTPIYRTWINMVGRCHNKKHQAYKWYGAKGIKVCPRWRQSFTTFLQDMGEHPTGMTLDRIDCRKGYCKSNCRWATSVMQNRNRKNNKLDLNKAKEIVAMVNGGKSKQSVADQFSVSRTCVRRIINGEIWKEATR